MTEQSKKGQLDGCYCGRESDGAMLIIGNQMAHATCVIRKLNELLDPDYDGKGEPDKVVGFLAGYVKLAKDQSLPSSGEVVLLNREPFEAGYHLGQLRMVETGWRKVEVKDES